LGNDVDLLVGTALAHREKASRRVHHRADGTVEGDLKSRLFTLGGTSRLFHGVSDGDVNEVPIGGAQPVLILRGLAIGIGIGRTIGFGDLEHQAIIVGLGDG